MTKSTHNRLSIYLIKSEYVDAQAILEDIDNLNEHKLRENMTLFYGDSNVYRPKWASDFFEGNIPDQAKIFNASCKAILLVQIEIAGMMRIFSIPFGQGRHLMQSGVWEEGFGLKVTLNTLDPNGLRRIEKTNMSSVPKHANEQISRDGPAADFGIDIEQDLVRGLTGKSKENLFGVILSGKDSLHASVKINVSNIEEFLRACFTKYQSNNYKKDFGWIDHVSEIKDLHLIRELNQELINRVAGGHFEKTWMAVPEIIEWDDVAGFRYRQSARNPLEDDISIPAFLASLSDTVRRELSINLLKNRKIYCISASNDLLLHKWPVYNCIYCEANRGAQTYLLNNGKWFQINEEFAMRVNSEFESIRDAETTLTLPECGKEKENEYNNRVAIENDMLCLDSKNIVYGGGYSRIEFCDLLTKDKKIVHVKKYGGSSVLSHLFSQAVVSGEVFLSAEDFRHELNNILKSGYKLEDASKKPDPGNYQIVFGVISKSAKELDIPFFSKVTFRNAKRRLEAFGFQKVSLVKIQQVEA